MFLNARGPRLNEAMNRFAAKLALALHFKMTGAIASTAAAVAGRWYSNHQAYTGAIPDVLLEAVRDAAGTLVQGKWNVGEQFAYAGAHTPSGKQSLFVARFREAFAVAGMVYDDLEPPEVEGFSVVRPGFLRSNSRNSTISPHRVAAGSALIGIGAGCTTSSR